MRIIVTAGPTREFLDDVRFLSNPSSGRMGFAVAEAAAQAGHRVTLVAGPVSLPTPAGVERVDVVSAVRMREAVVERFDACDALVMAAAVCDYRPARRHKGKIRKTDEDLVLRLRRNPDILAELGGRKGGRILMGFALEADLDRRSALRKLTSKNLDAIVLNTVRAFGAGRSTVEIITSSGESSTLRDAAKEDIARRLVSLLQEMRLRAAE